MKTFNYIVINKNDMTKLAHFTHADRVGIYLLGRKLNNIIVLINEETMLHLKDVPTSDVHTIERILEKLSKCTVAKSPNLIVQQECALRW